MANFGLFSISESFKNSSQSLLVCVLFARVPLLIYANKFQPMGYSQLLTLSVCYSWYAGWPGKTCSIVSVPRLDDFFKERIMNGK